uniref:Synaptobrevin, longin-like domain protein n=1 Tax=Tanacetum cinerariifolium TaxID=118510 RepID=A0A6L2LGV9_TANCI|nr:hypothetical protein [Tanacetum cinerariifolium]
MLIDYKVSAVKSKFSVVSIKLDITSTSSDSPLLGVNTPRSDEDRLEIMELTTDDVTRLQALVDRKKVVITKAAIRDVLRLDDAEGVDCLPNEEIFAELARMGYEKPSTKLTFYKAFFSSQWKFLIHNILQSMSAKRTSWNKFSSAMTSAVICLSTGDLSTHTTKYTSHALTQKVFANMRRVGKGFSGNETPLFEGMLVAGVIEGEGAIEEQVQDVTDDVAAQRADIAVQADDAQEPSIPSPTPPTPPPQRSQDLPSTSQEALDACAALTRRVEHLKYDKVAQALEITKLKRRVMKLEKGNRVKVLKLRRLKKVGTLQRIDTSEDTVMEDASNQGRMIDNLDKDDVVALMDDKEEEKKEEEVKDDQVQGRQAEIYKIDMDHASKVLSMQEDESVEVQEVVDVVTTAKLITEVVTAASETVTAVIRVAAASTRRRKCVVIRDLEEESTTIIPADTKSKDKGKEIMVEEPKPLKKKQQIKMDEEYARKLHEELNKDIDWDVAIDHVKQKAKEDPAVQRYQGMSYDDIRPIFKAKFNSNIEFLLKTKQQLEEEENRAIQSINETPAQKAAKRRKLNEEVKDLKRHLEIVLDEDDDVYTEATPLARKTEQGDSAGGGGEQGMNIQPITETTDAVAEDVILLQPRHLKKRKTIVADAGGPLIPPNKLREDHGTSSGAFVGDSSHHSGANIMEAEVDSFTRPSVPVITTATTITSTADPAVVVKENIVEPSLFAAEFTSAGGTDPAMAGLTDLTGNDFLVGGIRTIINPDSDLQKTYFFTSVREMEHDQLFIEFNVRATCHISLSAKVRMCAEYNIRENRRLKSVVEEKNQLLKARDEEIENLKAQLLLKEAEAVEAIRLRIEASKLETTEKSLRDEVNALNERNTILEKERNALDVKVTDLEAVVVIKERELTGSTAQLTSIKSQNDNLADQVHELQVYSSELKEKLSNYENLTEQLDEFQDAQLKVVNDKFDKLYTNFVEMTLHLEEMFYFYPHLLKTIIGRIWLLSHRMKLAVTKCLNSPEYLSALGTVVNKAIEKGMQDGLAVEITHGKEGRVLTDVAAHNLSVESNKDASIEALMNILLLEEHLAEILCLNESQSDVDQLMVPIHHSSDTTVVGASALSLTLDVSDARVRRIKENIISHRSLFQDVFIPLAEPFFAAAVTCTEGTSDTVPATADTTASLSVSFTSASIVDPISIDDYEITGTDDQPVATENVATANVNPFPNVDNAGLNIPAFVTSYGPSHLGPSFPVSFARLASLLWYTRLKKDQEKDKIRSKPDKNGKRGEAGKRLKQLQWIKEEKPKTTQKE